MLLMPLPQVKDFQPSLCLRKQHGHYTHFFFNQRNIYDFWHLLVMCPLLDNLALIIAVETLFHVKLLSCL